MADRSLVFCFSFESLTEGLKMKHFCLYVYFLLIWVVFIWVVDWRVENKTFLLVCFFSFSPKNSINLAHWEKRWRNCWVQLWRINVMGTFFWFFLSILKNLLMVHKSSKSHSNTLPQTERCHVCCDWSNDAKCEGEKIY